jgi:hypothetical protein
MLTVYKPGMLPAKPVKCCFPEAALPVYSGHGTNREEAVQWNL